MRLSKAFFLLFCQLLPGQRALSNENSVITLPDSWPIEAEQTPVTLFRMMQFFYATQYYLAGYLPDKPYIYPNAETWIQSHTTLFRQYAISLEALIFSFLYTSDPAAEFQNGNKFIYFVSLLYPMALAELAETQASCQILMAEIKDDILKLQQNRASINSDGRAIVDSLLLQISGKLADTSIIETLKADSGAKCLTNANICIELEEEIAILNQAHDEGLPIDWIKLRSDAQKSLEESQRVTPEAQDDYRLMQESRLSEKTFLEELWMVQSQITYLSGLIEIDKKFKVYIRDVYQSIQLSLEEKRTAILNKLELLRRVMVETLQGGTYFPDDFSNNPPTYDQTFKAPMVKYISFKSFIRAWGLAGLPVKTVDDLQKHKLENGMLSLLGSI